jgi:hypothetical protein
MPGAGSAVTAHHAAAAAFSRHSEHRSEHGPPVIGRSSQVTGISLPREGNYRLNLLVNDQFVGDRPFRVLKGYT